MTPRDAARAARHAARRTTKTTQQPRADNCESGGPHRQLRTGLQDAGSTRPRRSICARRRSERSELYGLDDKQTDDFGRQCLLARRLVERGVRFVQLYSGGNHNDANWDAHGDLKKNHDLHAGETDKPIAGLLKDLKQRGLLDETLVVWGGEFGRQPTAEYAKGTGRDHNAYGFTMWMAGGGIKGGVSVGTTDELGSAAVERPLPRQAPARHDPASAGPRPEPPLVLLRRAGSEAGRRRRRRADHGDHRVAVPTPTARRRSRPGRRQSNSATEIELTFYFGRIRMQTIADS